MKIIGLFLVITLYTNEVISAKLRIHRQTEAPIPESDNLEAIRLDDRLTDQDLPPCPTNPNIIIFPEDPRFTNSSFLCNPNLPELTTTLTTVAPTSTSIPLTSTTLVTKTSTPFEVTSSTLPTTDSSKADTFSTITLTPMTISTESLSPNSENQTSTTTSDNIGSTTLSPQQECIRRCPVTAEYNPVCGSNLVTYLNPGRLTCARTCGVGVNLRGTGPCPTSTTSTTAATSESTEPIKEANILNDCLIRCPSTPEYNPVCGSNLMTYINAGRLMCAQSCGVQVTLQRRGPCPIAPTQASLLTRNQDLQDENSEDEVVTSATVKSTKI